MHRASIVVLAVVLAVAIWMPKRGGVLGASRGAGGQAPDTPQAVNARPIRLMRPVPAHLSQLAEIGRDIFFDVRLSGSGAISCATCHSPNAAYGPSNDLPVQLGGLSGRLEGGRAVPSLRYVDRTPAFGVGPDLGDAAPPAVLQMPPTDAVRPRKIAGAAAGPPLIVPRGGLFWDGRAGSLQTQAAFPLLNPAEMANKDTASLLAKIHALGYADRLLRAIGGSDAKAIAPTLLLDEAMFAVGRFEFEDPSFHPYSSKYDSWLEGTAALTAAEVRGLRVFEDPAKGNCAACHLDRPGPDGVPPAFTDWQYEALGVPRNDHLAINHDPRYFDLGLCGPMRTDLAKNRQWCGMFRTPSLRNVATRGVFFHNGVYHTLEDVLRFYDFRDTRPDLIYPVGPDGRVMKFNDLPASLEKNVDVTDAPFDRRQGGAPAMSDQDLRDVISFLRALTDEPVAAGSNATRSR